MTTGADRQVKHLEGYLKTLDSYVSLDERLLPIFVQRDLSSARAVVDAVVEVAPDAAQDARYWLLSAMQRDLVSRDAEGHFELSPAGLDEIKQPA